MTRLSKYRDLSVASRSIIRLRQIIDLRDTEFFFNEYPWEAKQSAIFMQERSQGGEKHGCLYA